MVLTGGPIVKVGHFEADGAEVDLVLGFVPDYIRIVNASAAAGEIAEAEWFSDMAAGTGIIRNMIADDGTTSKTNFEWLAAAHPISKLDERTIDEGTENDDTDPVRIEAKKGVTIAASFMDDSDEIWYIAFGNANQEDHGDINA